MTDITYFVVEHDGGWAYRLDGAYSETFPTRDHAIAAARTAAREQEVPGENQAISYQDGKGGWHEEQASGSDRPTTHVQ